MSIWIWLVIALVVVVVVVITLRNIKNNKTSSKGNDFWDKVKSACCLRRTE